MLSNSRVFLSLFFHFKQICKEACSAIHYEKRFQELTASSHSTDTAEVVALSAVSASFKVSAAAIIVLTTSGRYADLIFTLFFFYKNNEAQKCKKSQNRDKSKKKPGICLENKSRIRT